MGCTKSSRYVRIEQLVDYYLTKSLEIDQDSQFKNEILDEWGFEDKEVDNYIRYNYPKIILPAIVKFRRSSVEEEAFYSLLSRFRKLFPTSSRKGLTTEFKKLSNVVFKEDSGKGIGRPLGFAEFKVALASNKPEIVGQFTERGLLRFGLELG
jgi:hypothetical protein